MIFYAASTAVTFAPVYLFAPVLEVSVERPLSETLTAAAIIGGGWTDGEPVWEGGAQGRYLLRGDFGANLHAAVEVLYVGSRAASALGAGPLLGAKWTADVGFTAEIQLGAAYNTVVSGVEPNVNINLGWSF